MIGISSKNIPVYFVNYQNFIAGKEFPETKIKFMYFDSP
jgi:hypothetical protein